MPAGRATPAVVKVVASDASDETEAAPGRRERQRGAVRIAR
jgi:hypothetical protein